LTSECQPSTLMPASAALMMLTFCSVASSLSAMMTSGLSAIAWPKAAARLAMTPAPSRMVSFQPIAFAASVTPSLTPSAPPLRWFSEMRMTVFPGCALGPVVGPSQGTLLAAAAATISLAAATWAAMSPSAARAGLPIWKSGRAAAPTPPNSNKRRQQNPFGHCPLLVVRHETALCFWHPYQPAASDAAARTVDDEVRHGSGDNHARPHRVRLLIPVSPARQAEMDLAAQIRAVAHEILCNFLQQSECYGP